MLFFANRLKSLFISTWITLLIAGLVRASWQWWHQPSALDWAGVVLALAPSLLFFVWVFALDVARTARVITVALGLALLGAALLWVQGTAALEPWLWVLGVGVGGTALYKFWYSTFGARETALLKVGSALPPLRFELANGTVFETGQSGQPQLMIFYRGNWCPLCMAQVKEIADQYRQLADKGVQVLLISPQPHGHTASLSKRFDAPMTFLVDKDNRMAVRLGIQAPKGLPSGLELMGYDSDTVMPTVLITDATGRIIYADLTSNYRIRPEPDAFLEVLTKAGI